MKLKVKLLSKCPDCGLTMRVVKAPTISKTYAFKYCPDPQCRYAEVVE